MLVSGGLFVPTRTRVLNWNAHGVIPTYRVTPRAPNPCFIKCEFFRKDEQQNLFLMHGQNCMQALTRTMISSFSGLKVTGAALGQGRNRMNTNLSRDTPFMPLFVGKLSLASRYRTGTSSHQIMQPKIFIRLGYQMRGERNFGFKSDGSRSHRHEHLFVAPRLLGRDKHIARSRA
jgi:hypothetical protein